MKETFGAQLVIPRRLSFRAEGQHHLPKPGLTFFMDRTNLGDTEDKPAVHEAFGYSVNYSWGSPKPTPMVALSPAPFVCPCSAGI
jgi:hypothetical protein